jgi:LmbE family N-acetylglucosaminyl deacetylase
VGDVRELGTILGVWAHPDDEAYLMGGIAVLGAAAGQHVACVTATYGEGGESADPDRWRREELAEVRRHEMAASLKVLGITDHEWFGLPDGGLADVDPDHGIDLVAAAIERVEPDTVLTFGPDGMTGHPDHRTISAWTAAAFAKAAPSTSRLLAATKRDGWAQEFPEINEVVFPDGPPCAQPNDLAFRLRLDDSTLERKIQALEAQASQTTGLIATMGRQSYAEWVRDEEWVRMSPLPHHPAGRGSP